MLLIDGQLDCFQVLVIMNKSFYEYMFSFLSSKYLKGEGLSHRELHALFYKQLPDLFQSGCTILHSH